MPQTHIIILTYGFPPYTKSLGGAIRMLKLAEYFTMKGFDVSVVCARTPFNNTYGYESALQKIRIRTCPDPLAYLAGSTDSSSGGNNNQRLSVWTRFKTRLFRRLKDIILELMMPDSGRLTIHSMVKIVEQEISGIKGAVLLVTSGPPHSAHLAGRVIKKKFPQVRWIMDYRDSWNGTSIFRKKNKLLQSYNTYLEAKCLLGSDHITYVSEPMLKKIEAIAGAPLGYKSCLISNGYDENLQPSPSRSKDRNELPFRIGYFGALDDARRGYRDPTCLFMALDLLANEPIQFVVHGPSALESEWQFRLGPRLVLGGKLGHKEALHQMNEMDALLLLHTREDGADEVLTGKVFEYIATGLPIISVGPRDMAVNTLLADDAAFHWVSHHDPKGIVDIFKKLLIAKETGRIQRRDSESISVHSRMRQHEKFLSLVTG